MYTPLLLYETKILWELNVWIVTRVSDSFEVWTDTERYDSLTHKSFNASIELKANKRVFDMDDSGKWTVTQKIRVPFSLLFSLRVWTVGVEKIVERFKIR